MTTGIILLAAGESRRLGRPKQLIDWEGEPLLRRMARIALETDLGPVVVVLGAVDQPCREALKGLPLAVVWNADWRTGMGCSIAAGLTGFADLEMDEVIVLLCDQPRVDANLLWALASLSAGQHTAACHFHGKLGPPAAFPRERFGELRALAGAGGAKSLLRGQPGIRFIEAPQAGIDIDTPEDLERVASR